MQLPMMDINLDLLFNLLSCENVITIFSLMLTEYSVVFTSEHLPTLTSVAEVNKRHLQNYFLLLE